MNHSTRHVLKWSRRTALAVLLIAAISGGYLGGLQLTGNVHTVIPHTLYRSAQPNAAEIDSLKKRYGIKTIINLRGRNTGEAWYDSEVAEAARLGIRHIDFGMSANKELPRKRAAELVALMANAAKPLLIHCKAGADRAGLASALYLAAIAKEGEVAAEGQISIRYGHISLPISPTYAMDTTFEELEPWLGLQRKRQIQVEQ